MEIIKANEVKKIASLAQDNIRKHRIETLLYSIEKEIKYAAGSGYMYAQVRVDFDLRKPIEAILAAHGYECSDPQDIDEQGLLRVSW